MNIAFLNSIKQDIWRGGEKWMVDAASGLQKRGHKVVVCGKPGALWLEYASDRGIRTKHFRIRGDFAPVIVYKMAQFFRSQSIDVLCCNFEKDVRIGGTAARLVSVPVVMARKGLPLIYDKLRYRFTHKVLVDGIITPAEHIKDRFIEFSWLDQKRIHVIRNGVQLPDVCMPREEIRRKLGIGQDNKVVSAVGNLFFQKGLEFFAEAAKLTWQKHRKAHFMIVGDGPDRQVLEDRVRSWGLNDNFTFTGFRKDVPDLLRASDVFVLTSLDEGLPNVILEAMAAGIPVVATHVGGVNELVVDKVTGFLVQPKDVRAIADGIARLLNDEDLASKMGQDGAERVRQEFTLEKNVDELERLFERELERNSRVRWGGVTPTMHLQEETKSPVRYGRKASKLNVMFVNSAVEWGGNEKWTIEAASGIRESGHNVYLACRWDLIAEKKASKSDIKILRLPFLNDSDLYTAFKIALSLKKMDIDILVPTLQRDYVLAGLAAKLHRPTKVLARMGIMRRPLSLKMQIAFRWLFDKLIVNTHAIRDYLSGINWFDIDKVVVIYNGLRAVPDGAKSLGLNIREKYEISEHEILITGLGRLAHQKRFDLLIKAFSYVALEHPQARLMIVGSGERLDSLKDMAREFSIFEKVIFTGFIDDVNSVLEATDIFALSSEFEGMPNALLEAMSRAIPLVAFKIPGIAEVIKDRENGLLVDFGDVRGMSEAISVLIQDPVKEKALGKAALETIRDKFSYQRMIEELEFAFYRETPKKEERKSAIKPPQRIVLFTEHFPPKDGGIARWCHEVARHLVARHLAADVPLSLHGRREAIVFATKKCFRGNAPWKGDFKIEQMEGRGWVSLKHYYMVYYTIKALLKYRRPVILSACWDMAFFSTLISRWCSLKVVVACHGMEIKRRYGPLKRLLMRYVLENCHRLIAVSRHTKESLKRIGISVDKIVLIPNGVDTERFRPLDRQYELKTRYGFKGKKVILTLARIVERKGQDMVITAMPFILKRYKDVHYLIAGKGEYRPQLEDLVHRLGLGEHVTFLGYIPDQDMCEIYNMADVYIMASRETEKDVEGFGITFLEASACRVAVIGGRSGGVEDAVEDGCSGVLIDPKSPEQIAETVIRLLDDEKLRVELGKQGRKRAVEKFNWNAISRRIERLLA